MKIYEKKSMTKTKLFNSNLNFRKGNMKEWKIRTGLTKK